MKEKGFTLIELLVVVAIIGILAAIAIPQFAAYRARGFDARARSDLRNAATAEEAYFVDNEKYVDAGCPGGTGANAATGGLPGLTNCSNGVVLAMTAVGGGVSFTGTASHPKGTAKTFTWNSTSGGATN